MTGNSNQQRKTTMQKEAKHKVIAYTYYIITKDNQPNKEPAKYVGEDAAQHFYNSIVANALEIEKKYHLYPMYHS